MQIGRFLVNYFIDNLIIIDATEGEVEKECICSGLKRLAALPYTRLPTFCGMHFNQLILTNQNGTPFAKFLIKSLFLEFTSFIQLIKINHCYPSDVGLSKD